MEPPAPAGAAADHPGADPLNIYFERLFPDLQALRPLGHGGHGLVLCVPAVTRSGADGRAGLLICMVRSCQRRIPAQCGTDPLDGPGVRCQVRPQCLRAFAHRPQRPARDQSHAPPARSRECMTRSATEATAPYMLSALFADRSGWSLGRLFSCKKCCGPLGRRSINCTCCGPESSSPGWTRTETRTIGFGTSLALTQLSRTRVHAE